MSERNLKISRVVKNRLSNNYLTARVPWLHNGTHINMKIYKLVNGKFAFEGPKGKVYKFDNVNDLKIALNESHCINPSEITYGLEVLEDELDNVMEFGVNGIFIFTKNTLEDSTRNFS